ncbi:hypothetical protein FRB91_005792 [Serendipita sp. 411]|nr:hypothetical protein FRB91_005792 [Serendipita sp. 411]
MPETGNAKVYTFKNGEGEPDFTVLSSIDKDVEFRVQRAALAAGSEVFQDMFSVCDVPDVSDVPDGDWENVEDVEGAKEKKQPDAGSTMTMAEDANVLRNLFRVLHDPPISLPSATVMAKWVKLPHYMQGTGPAPPLDAANAIPFPLLKKLFLLNDKYIFKPTMVATLHTHLAVHAFDEPLEVYAMSTILGIDDVAAFASTQLHSPPLESYSLDQISILPSITSLHLLYQLHAVRRQRLCEVLAEEPLFPRGYGECPTKGHTEKAEEAWRKQKRILLSMGRIQAGADLSIEMMPVAVEVSGCVTCHKAYQAAIGMLQYKSAKIPQSISNLPEYKILKQTSAAVRRLVI